MAANGAGSCFFPTNPALADILGDTDFDSENLDFLDFVGSQISGKMDAQLSGKQKT